MPLSYWLADSIETWVDRAHDEPGGVQVIGGDIVDVESCRATHVGSGLTATGLEHSHWDDADILSIKLETNPHLVGLQTDLIEALPRYPRPAGERDAFVTSPGEPEIDAETIQYVQTFEQEQVGDRFTPHITIGTADAALAEQLTAQSTTPMNFTIDAMAIYQLGNVAPQGNCSGDRPCVSNAFAQFTMFLRKLRMAIFTDVRGPQQRVSVFIPSSRATHQAPSAGF